MQETREMWVQSLGGEDHLEKEMTTPPEYSCVENSMDRGAWWATVQGVVKNQIQLSKHTHTHTHTALSYASTTCKYQYN